MIFLSTQAFDEADVARLEALGHELILADTGGGDPHGMSSDEYSAGLYALPEAVREAAVGIIMPSFHVTERLLEACPSVRWIHHPGAGVNSGTFWTRWEMLDDRGVLVTTAKIHAVPISEWIVATMMMLAKGMPQYHERQKKHLYRGGERPRSLIVEGRTALIVGPGHVGQETARKLKTAFHMTVLGINSDGRALTHFDAVGTLGDLPEMAALADFVITTAVLVEETEGMIGAEVLDRMKPTAFLINPSRGGLIDETALIEALREERIGGAALDTFEHEPLDADSPLWDMEQVIITPHVSGGRPDYNTAVMDRLLANLPLFEQGRYGDMIEVANVKRY